MGFLKKKKKFAERTSFTADVTDAPASPIPIPPISSSSSSSSSTHEFHPAVIPTIPQSPPLSPFDTVAALSFSPCLSPDLEDLEERWSNELSHSSPSISSVSPTKSEAWSVSSLSPTITTTTTSTGNNETCVEEKFVSVVYEGKLTPFKSLPIHVQNSLSPILLKFPTRFEEGLRFAIGKASPPNDPHLALELFEKHLAWRSTFPLLPPPAPGEFRPSGMLDESIRQFQELGGFAKDGSRIVAVCGGRYDKDKASIASYVERSCHVMDEVFPTETTPGGMTFLIFVKGQEGMKNESAISMMSYFRGLIKIMNPHYPERLIRLIIYPVPRLLVSVVGVVKKIMDKNTANKIVVLSGSGKKVFSKLWEYVDYDQLPKAIQGYHHQ